jgi:hypothetical protein
MQVHVRKNEIRFSGYIVHVLPPFGVRKTPSRRWDDRLDSLAANP